MDELDSLVHLEQTFYDEGFKDGHAHGRIHGLIEGRALGREKGFEMWEELGYYEGFAITWRALLTKLGKLDERKAHHIATLLALIAQFPATNPKPTEGEVDIMKLLRQIRSKYKLVCAVLGVRPRVHSADGEGAEGSPPRSDAGAAPAAEGGRRRMKASVWDVQPEVGSPKKDTTRPPDLSF